MEPKVFKEEQVAYQMKMTTRPSKKWNSIWNTLVKSWYNICASYHMGKYIQTFKSNFYLFSSPADEATLPVIYSMFYFEKDEQAKLNEMRQNNNAKMQADKDKEKGKSMFGKLLKKTSKMGKDGKMTKTEHSFNSGGGSTN